MNENRREELDRHLFDRTAPKYAKKDLVASSSIARRFQLLSALRPVLRELPCLGIVVDIGCGVGAPAHYLLGLYEQYLGIDQSREMILVAQALNQSNRGADFRVANVKQVDLPPDMADLILSIGALHHMTALGEVMDALSKIAKPGAFLVLIEPQNSNPAIQLMRRARTILDRSYSSDQVFFSETELVDLLAGHGITDLVVDYQGFISPAFAQVVMYPQVLSVPLSRMATRMDLWLASHLPKRMKRLAFNIVIVGTFTK